MRRGRFFRSERRLFLAWAVIPILIYSCSCGKSVENNTTYRDTARTEVKEMANTLKSLTVYDTQRDSIHIKDSTVVNQRGDTVLVDRWHMQFVYRNIGKTIRDTVRIVTSRDSTEARATVSTEKSEKTVEKKSGGGLVHTISFLALVLTTTFLTIFLLKSKNS